MGMFLLMAQPRWNHRMRHLPGGIPRSVLERMRSHLPLTVDAVEIMGEDACAVLSGKVGHFKLTVAVFLLRQRALFPRDPSPRIIIFRIVWASSGNGNH